MELLSFGTGRRLAAVFFLGGPTAAPAQQVVDSVSGPIEAAVHYALEHDDGWAHWSQDPGRVMIDVEAASGDIWREDPAGLSPDAGAALRRVAAAIGARTGTLAPLLTCPEPGSIPTPEEFDTWGCKMNPGHLRVLQVSMPVREGDTLRVGVMGIIQSFKSEGVPSGMAGKAMSVILEQDAHGQWRAVRFHSRVSVGHF